MNAGHVRSSPQLGSFSGRGDGQLGVFFPGRFFFCCTGGLRLWALGPRPVVRNPASLQRNRTLGFPVGSAAKNPPATAEGIPAPDSPVGKISTKEQHGNPPPGPAENPHDRAYTQSARVQSPRPLERHCMAAVATIHLL